MTPEEKAPPAYCAEALAWRAWFEKCQQIMPLPGMNPDLNRIRDENEVLESGVSNKETPCLGAAEALRDRRGNERKDREPRAGADEVSACLDCGGSECVCSFKLREAELRASCAVLREACDRAMGVSIFGLPTEAEEKEAAAAPDRRTAFNWGYSAGLRAVGAALQAAGSWTNQGGST